MAELSSQTLHIVARELNSELNDARTALEAFGEQQDNVALLTEEKKAAPPSLVNATQVRTAAPAPKKVTAA